MLWPCCRQISHFFLLSRSFSSSFVHLSRNANWNGTIICSLFPWIRTPHLEGLESCYNLKSVIVMNIRLNNYRILMSWLHVNLSILIPWTMCQCYSLYNLLPHESMWQEYEQDQWGPDPRKKRTAKGRPISTRISTEIDEKENERKSRKNVKFAGNMAIRETIILTYLHLIFS